MKKNHFLSKIIFSVLMTLIVFTSIAQTSEVPVINQKQEHVLQSKINGNTYFLSVSLPMHYSKTDTTHYPVLYMLDGDIAFRKKEN